MSTCHTESFVLTRQGSQHLGALLDVEAFLTEILQFLMIVRDGRCIDDLTCGWLATGFGNQADILLIVNEHAFQLQLAGERAGRLVVAGNNKPLLQEIAGNGTHAYASGSYEIDCFDILNFHCLLVLILLLLSSLLKTAMPS